jgi:hypothetical protein
MWFRIESHLLTAHRLGLHVTILHIGKRAMYRSRASRPTSLSVAHAKSLHMCFHKNTNNGSSGVIACAASSAASCITRKKALPLHGPNITFASKRRDNMTWYTPALAKPLSMSLARRWIGPWTQKNRPRFTNGYNVI